MNFCLLGRAGGVSVGELLCFFTVSAGWPVVSFLVFDLVFVLLISWASIVDPHPSLLVDVASVTSSGPVWPLLTPLVL